MTFARVAMRCALAGYESRVSVSGQRICALAEEAASATEPEAALETLTRIRDELAEFGPFHLFRPHNDVRFAKGRPPYKTQQGAYGEAEGGAGYYLQISPAGLMVATGYYAMARDQLERFRVVIVELAEGITGTDGAPLTPWTLSFTLGGS